MRMRPGAARKRRHPRHGSFPVSRVEWEVARSCIESPPMDLSGRVVAITGATSGIGESTAVLAARAGAAVALAGRRQDRLDAVRSRIEDEGGRAFALATDIT